MMAKYIRGLFQMKITEDNLQGSRKRVIPYLLTQPLKFFTPSHILLQTWNNLTEDLRSLTCLKNASHWSRSIEIYTVSMLVNDVSAYHALRNSHLMMISLTGRFSTTTRPTPKAKLTKHYYRWRT